MKNILVFVLCFIASTAHADITLTPTAEALPLGCESGKTKCQQWKVIFPTQHMIMGNHRDVVQQVPYDEAKTQTQAIAAARKQIK